MKRYMEIMSVLQKNGLGFLFVKTALSRHPGRVLGKSGEDKSADEIARGIRLSCEQLGPTFVKLGQILSTRTDIVPAVIATELAKLQDSVAPFSYTEAKALIEKELNGKIEEVFLDFNEVPTAAASISQVYSAHLHSGQHVAVKVQRPNMKKSIETDLNVLGQIAAFVDKHTKYGKLYDLVGMVDELRRVMEQEIDFMREGENIDRFREEVLEDTNTTAPKVKWMYTTEKVLTMNFVEGIKINDIEALDKAGANKKQLAYDFVNSLITQILIHGFFHADPHPGNVMVVDGGRRIEFIDLGMAGSIGNRFRSQLTDMVFGVATKNTQKIARAIMDMDVAQTNVNQHKFLRSLDILLDEYLYVPLGEVNIADVFTSVFTLAATYKMKIPKDLTLVAKSLGTAQLIVEELDPKSSILSIAEKTIDHVIARRHTPKEIIGKMNATGIDVLDILKQLPTFILSFLRKTEENDYAIELKVKNMEKMEKNIETVLNRLSFSVVLLAVCIVMAGVIVAIGFRAGDSEALYDVSMFALRIGLVVAVVIVVGIIISMLRSGRK